MPTSSSADVFREYVSMLLPGEELELTPRLVETWEVISGDRQPVNCPSLQRPTLWVPDLEAKPWHESDENPGAKVVEAFAGKIRDELKQVGRRSGFQPYREPDNDWNVGDWGVLYLEYFGMDFPQSQQLAPTTVKAVRSVSRQAGIVAFSALKPGSRILPHCGSTNAKLKCHLGLMGLEDAEIRVGREWRDWEYDRIMIFDDSFEHEVIHEGSADRVVLMFDMWHYDLTAGEIRVLDALMRASASYRKQLDIIRETGAAVRIEL